MVDHRASLGAHAPALHRRSLTPGWCRRAALRRLSGTYAYAGTLRSARDATYADRLKTGLTQLPENALGVYSGDGLARGLRASVNRAPATRESGHVGCERRQIARRRTEEKRAEAFFPLRAPTTAADYRCSRRRSAGGDGGTTLFRSVSSDEDGGNPANIAASGASNQTERDARAAAQKNSVGPSKYELQGPTV
jgi:hypothetical protein